MRYIKRLAGGVVFLAIAFSLMGVIGARAFNINSPTGGDGYTPIIYTMQSGEERIYSIYHHQSPSGTPTPVYNINCVIAHTDQLCGGYPKYFSSAPGTSNTGPTDISTSTHPRYVQVTSRLYYAAQRPTDNGISCFDLETGTNCGYFRLGSLPSVGGTFTATIDGLEQSGTRLYEIGRDLRAYCFDTATQAACPGQPYAIIGATEGMPAYTGSSFLVIREVLEGRIYLLVNYGGQSPIIADNARVTCFDPLTNARCDGWTSLGANDAARRFTSIFGNYDASGTLSGICVAATVTGGATCWKIGTRAPMPPPPGLFAGAGSQGSVREEVQDGTRTYFATQNAVFCYDFALQSQCRDFTGPKTWPTVNGGNTLDYGYTLIGECFYGLGDAGYLWSFNKMTGAVGGAACPPATPPSPASLNVVTNVVNDDGGIATASSFTVHVKLSGADIAGSPGPGAPAPGTAFGLVPGTYTVSQSVLPGYTSSVSGDCNLSGSVTLAAGEHKTCTITDIDTPPPATLKVITAVINDDGGIATAPSFIVHVTLAGADVAGSPAGGALAPGTSYGLAPGAYTLREDLFAGYASSIDGDCDSNGTVTLAIGEHKTCTIINNDNAVPAPSSGGGGGGGGGGGSASISPLISLTKIPSPLALPSGPGPVTYTYTVKNLGSIPMIGVTLVDNKCTAVSPVSGDADADGQLDPAETWTYRCDAMLSETTQNVAIVSGVANGFKALDRAQATVVVGAALPPPLIHVTKIPDPLSLPFGGGPVTYTHAVTNIGAVALSNVRVSDDDCGPVKYVNGDVNGDAKLGIDETWIYTCTKTLRVSTTSTISVSGEGNFLRAYDVATVRVLVGSVPGFPNTGIEPGAATWKLLTMFGAFAAALASAFILRTHV